MIGTSWHHPDLSTHPSVDHAAVDDLAGARPGLKKHVVAGDLDQRESLVLIEVRRGHLRRARVAFAQLPARTVHEIRDAELRLDALVDDRGVLRSEPGFLAGRGRRR